MPATPPSSLLSALPPAERGRLLERAVPRRLSPGAVLHLEGDPEPRVHLIASGVVKLTTRDPGGREAILGLALPGELIGEIPAIDGKAQPTDALAATHCEVLGIDAALLREILARHGLAALAVARSLSARLRWVSDTALERTASDVPARLAGRLLDLAELLGAGRGHGEFDLPLVQADLASLAGMSRESACKTLRTFKARGLLDYSGRRVRILRPDLLGLIRSGAAGEEPIRPIWGNSWRGTSGA
jgi:CRP/FNR family transcriptional regulator, cyclic AMP receptor protein